MTAQDLRDALRARTLTREQAEALVAAVDVCEATLAFNAKPGGKLMSYLTTAVDLYKAALQGAGSGKQENVSRER